MKYLSLIFAVILAGCGSDSNSTRSATLSDIVGTWDESEEIGQYVDELYTVIKPDGSITAYDYDGDSFDNGSNCFYKSDAILSDQGNGDFLMTFSGSSIEHLFKITISGNKMITKSISNGQTLKGVGIRSNLTENHFTPICNAF